MIKFPELPKYKAQWMPLYFETIPGSGERFTFAVIAHGEDGKTDIRDTLRPGALSGMFGPQGDALHGMMIRAIIEIKKHLDAERHWLEAPYLFSNIVPGPVRTTLADNFEQVFDQAIRLCASLGNSTIGATESDHIDADKELRSWSGRIKGFVEGMRDELKPHFNQRVKIQGQDKPASTIGFIHNRYAANFGVLHSQSERVSADITAIKKRLWDLQQLKFGNLLVPETEIIVGHAAWELLENKPRMAKTLKQKLEILKHEAANNKIGVFTTPYPHLAAEHILRKVANG